MTKTETKSEFQHGADVDLRHEGSNLDEVIRDVLAKYPEDAFYFLNEGALRERACLFHKHFLRECRHSLVAYAMKANPRSRILEILMEEGIQTFDCASIGEIKKVLAVAEGLNKSIDPMFNHPIKRKCDIEEALLLDVDKLTVQSRTEIEKIFGCCGGDSEIEIMVRLQTLNKKAGINLSEKFGADLLSTKKMLEFLKHFSPRIKRSLAINIGSQNPDPDIFAEVAEIIDQLISAYGDFATLNLGGGMPVNYHKNESYDLVEYLKVISDAVRKYLNRQLVNGTQIVIEPGRALIAEAVDLVIPVLSVEERSETDCVYVYDGLFTSFSDAAVHGWRYNFRAVRQSGEEIVDEKKTFTLYGRTCDSGDVINKRVGLPAGISTGDFLWLRNAGAYMDSQGGTFNEFPLPKYVFYN